MRKTVANTSGYVYTTYNYTWRGGLLAHMTKGSDVLHFFYDAQNRPAKVDYNGTIYTYIHNLQGDIVGILDANGTVVVEYRYNAWGAQLSRTGELANTLGYANPFRYRGYIYDDETWMYWLRSRYYYPELHRFISADSVMDGAGLFGANLYAYCKNAPVGASDPSGHFLISAGALLYGAASLMFTALAAVAASIAADKIEHAIPILPGKSIDREINITIALTLPFALSQPRTESRTQDITITYPPQEEKKYHLAVAYGIGTPILFGPALTANEAHAILHTASFIDTMTAMLKKQHPSIGVPAAYGVYTMYGDDAYNLAIRFGTPRLDVASGAMLEHYNVYHSPYNKIHFWYSIRR